MTASIHAGDVLAGRYRMVDLLDETEGGWFWRAYDSVLHRHVAVHMIQEDDERGPALMEAARRSASLVDRRNLRVLDTDHRDGVCYVVNEWGTGDSLDETLAQQGPLPARQAAWLVAEVADTMAYAHLSGVAHGRLVPENVLVDVNGQVRVIGFAVDAALHGLPADRADQDVEALAGLLYAALTGKWPGDPSSAVPRAPRDPDGVLRPRQVRAGIPRALDQVCDTILRPAPEGGGGLTLPGLGRRDEIPRSAEGIRDALEEFLGEGMPGAAPSPEGTSSNGAQDYSGPASGGASGAASGGASGAASGGTSGAAAGAGVAMAAASAGAAASAADPSADPATDAGAERSAGDEHPTGRIAPPPSDRVDIPTEAGMPVFHDDEDDVEWMRARAHKPAPPPPFEEPPVRPLFAPDPVDGSPIRQPRPPRPAPATGRAEYWPWDTSTGAGTGSGHLPAVGAGVSDDVPGQRWMRLAWLVGGLALVLLAVVAAYQLGGGGGAGTTDDDPGPTDSPAASATALEPIAVNPRDFDPAGNPPEENPDLVPNAVDGDPATAWRTMTYDQQLGPAGLKTGVGLQLELGELSNVSQVQVRVLGGQTTADIYVTNDELTSLEDVAEAERVGELSGADQLELTLEEPAEGRYVTIWLTSLPEAVGGFRGEISEVLVLG